MRSAPRANALLLVVDPASLGAPLLRVVTGVCMAGVYPVGMKLASTWAKGDMGLMVGILVGALTLGSASPHLFNALGGVDWRIPLALASASARRRRRADRASPASARTARRRRASIRASCSTAWRDVPLRLANLGYLGHMWELYAMWAWIGVFLDASFALTLPAGDRADARPSSRRSRRSRRGRSARSAPAFSPTASGARRSPSWRWR